MLESRCLTRYSIRWAFPIYLVYVRLNGIRTGSFGANLNEITMVGNGGVIKAQPTLPSTDGSSFYDTWVSSGP